MMGQSVGTWVTGDTIKELHYTIEKFIAQVGTVTGWTVKLQGIRPGEVSVSLDVTAYEFLADPADANSAIAKFKAIPGSLTVSGKADTWECRLVFTKATDKTFTEPFALTMRNWP